MKMVIFPIQMDEHGDFPYKNCDFPHENAGSFPIQMDEHGDFPYKNGDFPHENGDFPYTNG